MLERPHDVVTFEEVLAYLRIPRSSLYKLAQEGKIPSQKVGRHWRFRRQAIERWMEGGRRMAVEGRKTIPTARVEATVAYPEGIMPLRYRLCRTLTGQRLEIVDEAVDK